MHILGYSERGIVNSLLHEVASSSSAEALLNALLRRADFPFLEKHPIEVVAAELLIEQSFSQFGSADAVLLINTGHKNISVFIEAKVKPAQRASWSIKQEFESFESGTASTVNSSNLFTQLYYKRKMVSELADGHLEALQSGVQFPSSSTRTMRKIGSNPVVLKALEKVRQHMDATYYLAIVPQPAEEVRHFFLHHLRSKQFAGYASWDVSEYAYLAWSDVEEFCRQHSLENTLRVFAFNEEQVYKS